MKVNDFIEQLRFAESKKTLYVMGGFGACLYPKNKTRYSTNNDYNKRPDRTKMIKNASEDTFAFDCVGLIKGILWGWKAEMDPKWSYGGAAYQANGVKDLGADAMAKVCKDLTTNFTKIDKGEIVWLQGHIGVYIGDGLVIECTPSWENRVQYTALGNIGKVKGFPTRTWTHHGHLPYVEYEEEPEPIKPELTSVYEWQCAAIKDGFKFPKYGADGKWGSECISVATKAICKKSVLPTRVNLTKIVQKTVGVNADGWFGSGTDKAVKAFQRQNGLVDDGVVGINTWKKILEVN